MVSEAPATSLWIERALFPGLWHLLYWSQALSVMQATSSSLALISQGCVFKMGSLGLWFGYFGHKHLQRAFPAAVTGHTLVLASLGHLFLLINRICIFWLPVTINLHMHFGHLGIFKVSIHMPF